MNSTTPSSADPSSGGLSLEGQSSVGSPTEGQRWLGRMLGDRRLMTLILLLAVVAGLSSYAILPRMEDPVLRRRVALVNTFLPGADAERVEALVSEKIEDRLRDIEEIKELRSVSRQGISTISIELLDSVMEPDAIWSRVRSRIEDALPSLPTNATRPQFEELEVRAYALIAGLTWHRQDPPDIQLLRRLAIDLQDVIQNLPGTDLVDRFGDPGEEIGVELDPAAVAALKMTPAEVASQLIAHDAKSSAGQVRQRDRQLLIEVGNQLDATSQIETIPIQGASERFVLLGDIANIRVGVPDPAGVAAKLEGHEAVVLGAMVRPSYRIDSWTKRADQAIEDFETELPAGIKIDFVLRQTEYVDQRLSSLGGNLLMGGMAVSLVIWLMMGFRSAVIVTLALPLASMMVLFFLRLTGIPIHQMSITGLIISLGLLIDNAIVIVDEVKSKVDRGDDPKLAAQRAVGHLAVPLIGSTITTALAFAPIALMPGPAGEFVGAIALSVMAAIFSSFFLAMTVIPAIASLVLRAQPGDSHRVSGFAWMSSGLRLPRMTRVYRTLLHFLMAHPVVGISVCLIAPVLGFGFAPTLREQFFPPSSRDQFHITVEGPAISSLVQTRATADRVEQTLREYDIERVDWFYGASAPQFYYNVIANRQGSKNFAQGLVTAKRGSDPSDLIRQLQNRLSTEIPSSRVLVRQLEQGPPFEAPIEVRLFGPDLNVLRQLGDDVRGRLIAMRDVSYSRSDLAEVLPMVSIDVDEEAARSVGLLPSNVADHFRLALEGAAGGSILQDNEQIPIVVRVGNVDRGDLNRISAMDLMATGSDGTARQVPLSAVSTISLRPESAAIVRLNRQRMNEIAAYLHAGVLPSEVQAAIELSLERDRLDLPPGYSVSFGGSTSKRNDAVGNLLSTVGVLATMMLATLVLSLGSFRSALIIGAVAVLSVGLGLLSLKVGGYSFGFMSIIGTMGLIGVAINDSIVVLAAIQANPQAASGDLDVLVDEVIMATRHIVATTLTTMAGFAPLILDGGTFWPPMAICIAGGVAGATLLALVFVPAVYRLTIARPRRQAVPAPSPAVAYS